MNMHWLDWAVIFVVITFFTALATATRKYTQSTSDFLAANRLAGRYLLTLDTVFGVKHFSVSLFKE